MPRTDEELMADMQAGDAAAFDELFARHRLAIYRRLGRIVADLDAAEDLVQEVFLRVWTRSASWNGSGTVAAWLHRIAFNTAMNDLRGRRRRREAPLGPGAPPGDEDEDADAIHREMESNLPGPDTEAERSEVRGLVRRLIDDLPEGKREVMELVLGQELTIREASGALGLPEGTVKSRLFYGKRAIERRLRDSLE